MIKKELICIKTDIQKDSKEDYYINKVRIQNEVGKIDNLLGTICPDFQELKKIKNNTF